MYQCMHKYKKKSYELKIKTSATPCTKKLAKTSPTRRQLRLVQASNQAIVQHPPRVQTPDPGQKASKTCKVVRVSNLLSLKTHNNRN